MPTANELTASPGVSSWNDDGNCNLIGNSAGDSISYNPTAVTFGGSTLFGLTYTDVDQTERTATRASRSAKPYNAPVGRPKLDQAEPGS